MADTSFLKIHPNIEVAQDLGESPHAKLRYTSQIQLLPFDPQPYLQATSGNINLSVGNGYKVFIVKCGTSFEVEVTEHVDITNFNGQLIVKISYLPYDFYTTPVYFRIDRGAIPSTDINYFSNKFLLTRNEEELTSRIDYKEKNRVIPSNNIFSSADGVFQSIRLQFYYNNTVDATEVEQYYQISTSQTVTPRVSVKEYSQWKTQLFNAWTLNRLSRALYGGKCYINQVRNYIIEGIERAEREGMSNVSENVFLTDPDEKDTINIIPVIIGDDWQTIPFLSSSSQPSSTHFLSSQSTITIPV